MVGMGVERHVRKLFRGIDEIIDDSLDNHKGCLLASLNVIRHEALEALRTSTGTAQGWAWIAEYMIFHVVRRTIERKINSEFRIKPILSDEEKSYVFEDPEEEFILGHGIPLNQLLNDYSDPFLKREPDICLLYKKSIILTVEVKTSVTESSVLQRTLTTLTGIQKRGRRRPRSRAFFVTFGRTLEASPTAVLREYKEFYNAKGRYVGRFDINLKGNPLFQELDNQGRKMKLLRLEECLRKVEKLLEKLPN